MQIRRREIRIHSERHLEAPRLVWIKRTKTSPDYPVIRYRFWPAEPIEVAAGIPNFRFRYPPISQNLATLRYAEGKERHRLPNVGRMNPLPGHCHFTDLNVNIIRKSKMRCFRRHPRLNPRWPRIRQNKCPQFTPFAAVLPISFLQAEPQHSGISWKSAGIKMKENSLRVTRKFFKFRNERKIVFSINQQPPLAVKRRVD